MTDVRVYLCFDLEHDRDLHDRLLVQAQGGSTFAIVSRSEAGEMTEAWTARVRGRITDADEVVVICGEHTDASPRVSAEVQIRSFCDSVPSGRVVVMVAGLRPRGRSGVAGNGR